MHYNLKSGYFRELSEQWPSVRTKRDDEFGIWIPTDLELSHCQ